MKLIMESWRSNQLLLEVDKKSVISFVKSIESNKITDEKIQQVFDKLEQKKDFLKLVDIFKKLDKESIKEGVLFDTGALLSVEGLELIDYIKEQPGGDALLEVSDALLALAYLYAKYKTSGGIIEPGDVQNTIEIATKGTEVDLVAIATGGG